MFGYLSCIYVSSPVCCCFLPGEVEILNSLICASPCLIFCYFCRQSLSFTLRVKWPSWRRRNRNTSCLCATFKCRRSLATKGAGCGHPAALLRAWWSQWARGGAEMRDAGGGERKDDGTRNPWFQPVPIVPDRSEADAAAEQSAGRVRSCCCCFLCQQTVQPISAPVWNVLYRRT